MTAATDITNSTIQALLRQISADAAKCAETAQEATSAMASGNRNQAIGTLLGIEAELDRLATLKEAVLALHGNA